MPLQGPSNSCWVSLPTLHWEVLQAQPCAPAVCSPQGNRASLFLPKPEHQSLAAPCWGGGDLPPPCDDFGAPTEQCEDRVLLSPVAMGVRAPWSSSGLLENPAEVPVSLVVASWRAFISCWCCTSSLCDKTPCKCTPALTLIFQFPLLQLCLDLI